MKAEAQTPPNLRPVLDVLERMRRRFGDETLRCAIKAFPFASSDPLMESMTHWSYLAADLCKVGHEELRTPTKRLPVVRARALVVIIADDHAGRIGVLAKVAVTGKLAQCFSREPSYIRQLRISLADWIEGDAEFRRLTAQMNALISTNQNHH